MNQRWIVTLGENVELISFGKSSVLDQMLSALAAQGETELGEQGIDAAQIRTLFKVHLRYAGTDSDIVVDYGNLAATTNNATDNTQHCVDLRTRFEQAYQQRYGFIMLDKVLIVEAVSTEIVGQTSTHQEPILTLGRAAPLSPIATI